MGSLSMILLTVLVLQPVVLGLGSFGLGETEKAIGFGVLAPMVEETALNTPPVGMNVYVIDSVARGVLPLLTADAVRVLLRVFVPILSLAFVRLIE